MGACSQSSISPIFSRLCFICFQYIAMYISINNEKKVPETKGVEEGSAKRNIARRHDHDPHRKEKKQGGGGGGKGKWNPTNDGSL